MIFYRPPRITEATDGFEYTDGWPGTISNINYPLTFNFSSPETSGIDGFEYSDGWPGTISNINYPLTFNFSSPEVSATENFESGW